MADSALLACILEQLLGEQYEREFYALASRVERDTEAGIRATQRAAYEARAIASCPLYR